MKGNEPCVAKVKSPFILSSERSPSGQLVVCASFICGLCSHVLCWHLSFPAQIFLKVHAVTPATVPGLCAETPTLSCLVLHTAVVRFKRASSNTAVGTGFVALFSPTGPDRFANRFASSALAHVCDPGRHP